MHEAIAWVRANAMPLASVEAGHGFADLEPLRHIIGDARIVSLGEATHGTREFFQLKHRLLEFCVSELGFTIFGIEASYPECLRINDYVLARHRQSRRGAGRPALLDLGHRGGAGADRMDAHLEPHARAQGQVLRLRHAVPDRGRACACSTT